MQSKQLQNLIETLRAQRDGLMFQSVCYMEQAELLLKKIEELQEELTKEKRR